MIRSLILIVIVLAVIGLASSIPNLRFFSNDILDVAFRKPAHVLVYFALGLLVSRVAFGLSSRPSARGLIVVGVMLLMATIAIADEANQSAVLGREASIVDVALDCVGAFAGVLVSMRSDSRSARTHVEDRELD